MLNNEIDDASKKQVIEEIKQKLLDAEFDLSQFMDLVVNQIQVLTNATGAVIELVENEEMVYRAATGAVKAHIGLRLKKEGSFSGLCVTTGEVLMTKDTETDSRVNVEACRSVGARSMVVVPLPNTLNPKYVLGVLKILSSEPNAFDESDVETLKLMSRFLSSALTKQMIEEVKDFF